MQLMANTLHTDTHTRDDDEKRGSRAVSGRWRRRKGGAASLQAALAWSPPFTPLLLCAVFSDSNDGCCVSTARLATGRASAAARVERAAAGAAVATFCAAIANPRACTSGMNLRATARVALAVACDMAMAPNKANGQRQRQRQEGNAQKRSSCSGSSGGKRPVEVRRARAATKVLLTRRWSSVCVGECTRPPMECDASERRRRVEWSGESDPHERSGVGRGAAAASGSHPSSTAPSLFKSPTPRQPVRPHRPSLPTSPPHSFPPLRSTGWLSDSSTSLRRDGERPRGTIRMVRRPFEGEKRERQGLGTSHNHIRIDNQLNIRTAVCELDSDAKW